MQPKCQPDLTEKNTQAEKFRPTPIAHIDCPGGPLERDGVEVEEAEKGHAFDEMWGVRKWN